MEAKGYKSSRAFASAGLAALFLALSLARTHAADLDAQGRRLAWSVLEQVAALARRTPTLDDLGKATLSQATTLLDLGEPCAPVLVEFLKRNADWRVRYWVVDELGYVGGPAAAQTLCAIAANRREREEVRLRALDSVLGVAERHNLRKAGIRARLGRAARQSGGNVRRKALRVLRILVRIRKV